MFSHVGHWESDVQITNILDWNDETFHLQLIRSERVLLPLGRRYVLVLYSSKQVAAQLLQFIKGFCGDVRHVHYTTTSDSLLQSVFNYVP